MITKLKKKFTKKYYKIFYKNRVVVDVYRDLHFLLAPENFVDRRLKANQPYENEQIDFVLAQIKSKNVDWFIDVGANIGLYSLLVAKNSQEIKKIIAIEAQIENYNQLCGNIFLNKFDRIIFPINIGASDQKNKVTFLRNMGNSTGTSRIQETAPSTTKFHRLKKIQYSLILWIQFWLLIYPLSKFIVPMNLPRMYVVKHCFLRLMSKAMN